MPRGITGSATIATWRVSPLGRWGGRRPSRLTSEEHDRVGLRRQRRKGIFAFLAFACESHSRATGGAPWVLITPSYQSTVLQTHAMDQVELTAAAQQWANDVLVWIGFGTLVGLVAKAIMPGRDPGGAVATLVMGIGGVIFGCGT